MPEVDSDGRIKVCETCVGGDALLCDLEDLCSYVGVGVKTTDCLDRCKYGPNCEVTWKSRDGSEKRARRHRGVVSDNRTFDDSLKVLSTALDGVKCDIPEDVLRRARLRSDALRLLNRCPPDNDGAVQLLSQAIDLESQGHASPPPGKKAKRAPLVSRMVELRVFRARLLGSRELGRYDEALADVEAALREEPTFAEGWIEKAKVLRRVRRGTGLSESLVCFSEALRLAAVQEPPPKGLGLPHFITSWAQRCAGQIEERLRQIASGGADFGGADAGDPRAVDSGNGSGWWKVSGIVGLSPDTCLYHLDNHPPTASHPCPRDLWHVKVCVDSAVREYTPVSTAEDWEEGRLTLMVKTYASGTVSKHFATLRPASQNGDIDEQSCWVRVTAPVATLRLPLRGGGGAPDTRLGVVAGGTGVAPALQLLRSVVDVGGPFGAHSTASLLYSSCSRLDVLMLDELREAEVASEGRVSVRHTLSGGGEAAAQADEPRPGTLSPREAEALPQVAGTHFYFATRARPHVARGGPPRTGPGEEAGLRGHVTPAMLKDAMPPPGAGARVVVSGPPGFWEDVSEMLLECGHSADALVQLHASSQQGSK